MASDGDPTGERPRKTAAWSGGHSREGTLPDGVDAASADDSADLSGTTLAQRYRVIKKIGQGGMGEVYLGEHVTINKKVAIKVLSERYKGRRDVISRFLQEARAASSIRHENVVDITDFGEAEDGSVFFVMEYLEGHELSNVMEAAGAMPWSRAKHVMLQILDALGAAHETGVIHRDVKPDNCFVVRRSGNRDFVKVLDFGIAKITTEEDQESLTRTGVIMGTANYMSPEQAHGDHLDPRTDLYSLGVILYEMLTGRLPFTGNNPMSVMYKHLHTDPIPPRSVAPECNIPEPVEAVVLKALAKEAGQRFQTADEFATALRSIPDELADTGMAAARPASKVPIFAGVGAILAIAIGVGAFLVTRGGEDTLTDETPKVASAETPAPAPEAEAKAQPDPTPEAEPEPVAETGDGNPEEASEPGEEAADAETETASGPRAVSKPSSARTAKKKKRAADEPSARRSSGEINKAISQQVASAAKQCLTREGAFPGERVKIKFTISKEGKVTKAKAGRKHAGTPMGACIEKAVKKAKFGPATEPQTAEHAFAL